MKLIEKKLTKKQEIDTHLLNYPEGNINEVAWGCLYEIEELYGDADDEYVLRLVEMSLEILKSAKRRKLFKNSVNEKTAEYIRKIKAFKKILSTRKEN